MEPIRVLIADDHPLFRDGLRTLLSAMPETEVVGEVATGEEAIAQAMTLQPDVILMDLHMPGLNGIEATRAILHSSPHIGILVLTMLEDDDWVFEAMRAGARGYLLKGADQAEIARALTVVSHGEAIFSPVIANRLTHYFATLGNISLPQAFPA
jgi:DNA-binding NarL/FixJ family response regulator